jgi:hypothetical protein
MWGIVMKYKENQKGKPDIRRARALVLLIHQTKEDKNAKRTPSSSL